MKITFHIERLVLDGLPVSRAQGHIVRTAVERELTQLLATRNFPHELRTGGAIPALRGGSIQVERRSQPAAVGKQIAGAVHRGMGSKKR